MNLEEALLEARRLLEEDSGHPREVWHPKYGWLIVDGKPTEALERWFADLGRTSEEGEK